MADLAPRLAEVHCQEGLLLQASGQVSEAESSFRQALDAAARMFKRSPLPCYPAQLARIERDLGLLLQARQGEEAAKMFAHAQQLLEKVARDYPDRSTDRSNLGAVLDWQAEALWKHGERKAAQQLLQQAHEHHRAAQRLNSKHPVYQQLRDAHQRLVEIVQQATSWGKEESPEKP
jgi:tetratricopeptide (TPR) repeat protein